MRSTQFELREIAEDIFRGSLVDCSIERAFARTVTSGVDQKGARFLHLGDYVVDLSRVRHIKAVAVGKAASPMLSRLLPHLQSLNDCDLQGVLIALEPPESLPEGFAFFAGGHPVPNEASLEGARAALQLVRPSDADGFDSDETLCLFLISGGGSAMMELPLDDTIPLEDTVSFYRELVHSRASIAEINCVRKHFSAVKGGRLAMAAAGSLAYSLLVSDVPCDHLDALASGPTLADTSTVEQCRAILARYHLLKRFPASVQRFFRSSDLLETPNAKELTSRIITLLTSDDLAQAAKFHAEKRGFYAVIDNRCDDWEYRSAAVYLLEQLRCLRRQHGKVCLISSGEVTVEIPAANVTLDADQLRVHGVGGRNQHFALYAATLLSHEDAPVVILSAGSDGVDGNSRSAGAIVDHSTLAEEHNMKGDGAIQSHSLLRSQAEDALRGFDSGTFLKQIGALIVTGPTGNNLRDLRLLLVDSLPETIPGD